MVRSARRTCSAPGHPLIASGGGVSLPVVVACGARAAAPAAPSPSGATAASLTPGGGQARGGDLHSSSARKLSVRKFTEPARPSNQCPNREHPRFTKCAVDGKSRTWIRITFFTPKMSGIRLPHRPPRFRGFGAVARRAPSVGRRTRAQARGSWRVTVLRPVIIGRTRSSRFHRR